MKIIIFVLFLTLSLIFTRRNENSCFRFLSLWIAHRSTWWEDFMNEIVSDDDDDILTHGTTFPWTCAIIMLSVNIPVELQTHHKVTMSSKTQHSSQVKNQLSYRRSGSVLHRSFNLLDAFSCIRCRIFLPLVKGWRRLRLSKKKGEMMELYLR